MKKYLVVLLLPLCLMSCFKHAEQHYTPQIYISALLRIDSLGTDTLLYSATSAGTLALDSALQVGDSICFSVAFDAVGNNLTAVHLSVDTTIAKFFFSTSEQLISALVDASQVSAGALFFAEGYNFVALPLTIQPFKAGDLRLSFTVESDSKFSPAAKELVCRVKDK